LWLTFAVGAFDESNALTAVFLSESTANVWRTCSLALHPMWH
jgi:hypothetical protein